MVKRSLWLLVIFILVLLPLTAEEPESVIESPEEKEAIAALFERMGEAFKTGNHRLLRMLVTARDEAEERRRDDIVDSARTEFKRLEYIVFDVLRYSVDERFGSKRMDVWVNLRTVCADRDSKVRHEEFHNDAFLLERQPDGTFLLVDSQYFLTLGRQQGVGLMADALLVSIGCVVGLVFWVWMGFETFSLRPRRPGWRTLVLLLPLLGALIFFVFCYLPGLFGRPAASEAAI